jgi:hypothetical protein
MQNPPLDGFAASNHPGKLADVTECTQGLGESGAARLCVSGGQAACL